MENIVILQLNRVSYQFKLVSKILFDSFYYILEAKENNKKQIKKLIDEYAKVENLHLSYLQLIIF